MTSATLFSLNLINLSYALPPAGSLFLRRFCAAPRVRRPTEGARISGDRSLSDQKGPLKIKDFAWSKKDCPKAVFFSVFFYNSSMTVTTNGSRLVFLKR